MARWRGPVHQWRSGAEQGETAPRTSSTEPDPPPPPPKTFVAHLPYSTLRTVPCVHICTTTKCSRAPRLLLQLLPKSLHPSSLAIHGYTSPKQAKPCCIASSPPTPRRDDPPPTRLRPARVSNRSHAFHPRAPGPVRVSAAVSTCHLVIILPFALSRRNQLPIRWYPVLCRSSCAKHPVAQSTAQKCPPVCRNATLSSSLWLRRFLYPFMP